MSVFFYTTLTQTLGTCTKSRSSGAGLTVFCFLLGGLVLVDPSGEGCSVKNSPTEKKHITYSEKCDLI